MERVRSLWLASRFANRRKHRRYPVSAVVEIHYDQDASVDAEITDVSAGGALIIPVQTIAPGTAVRIFHPASMMRVEARIIANDSIGTRVEFLSEGAGAIVSVWLRGLHARPLGDLESA
ncbi:MAG: PilZ domain-containing protein [Alphaproteobacteria bacterium]|nr:PilZ domain-containing protein [Alphaproteobacteria bacterium]MBU0795703.1 PilZ domain-containing protein [Alphaproteobacteria bacterium]MBU0887326.1 PilZ domain-containing protein [Alphaproteobacteria bacterium]MBU1811793.1 PilZ domain-containing protein [Alphaproteobacteria bacterium]MBU2091084.1 PilZ domain-containing protein [Alphaproteobacteria bacterium]